MQKTNDKLTKITIRGYKSVAFDTPITLELGDVNILLGANGAGKSNIISFFKMLGFMMSGSLQKFVAEAGSNQTFLYYGSKTTPKLSADLLFENDESYDIYRFELTSALADRLIVSSEEIEWGKKSLNGHKKRQLEGDFKESALVRTTDTTNKFIWNLLSGCKVYQFSDSSKSSRMRQSSTVESAHYLQSEANNLASFLYFLKNNYPESYNRIVDYVHDVVPQFKDFYLEPERGYISLKWVDTSANDYVFSPDQFSDGSMRFIALATLLLQPEETMPRVIIIDEPELGLHPYAIDQLAEMIKDAAMHVQVLVATQSPSLIDRFDMNDITIVERDEDSQCTTVKKLDANDYEEWINEYTLSELWNKNVIGGRPV